MGCFRGGRGWLLAWSSMHRPLPRQQPRITHQQLLRGYLGAATSFSNCTARLSCGGWQGTHHHAPPPRQDSAVAPRPAPATLPAVGLMITVPICWKYKTEKPLFAAAVTCPTMDMMYGACVTPRVSAGGTDDAACCATASAPGAGQACANKGTLQGALPSRLAAPPPMHTHWPCKGVPHLSTVRTPTWLPNPLPPARSHHLLRPGEQGVHRALQGAAG